MKFFHKHPARLTFLGLGLIPFLTNFAVSQDATGSFAPLSISKSFHVLSTKHELRDWKKHQKAVFPSQKQIFVEVVDKDKNLSPKIVQKTLGKKSFDMVVIRLTPDGESFYVSKDWYDKAVGKMLTQSAQIVVDNFEGKIEPKIIDEKDCDEDKKEKVPVNDGVVTNLIDENTPQVKEDEKEKPVVVQPVPVPRPIVLPSECSGKTPEIDAKSLEFVLWRVRNIKELEDYRRFCVDESSPNYYPKNGGTVADFIRTGHYGFTAPTVCTDPNVRYTEKNYTERYKNGAISLRGLFDRSYNYNKFTQEVLASEDTARKYYEDKVKEYCLIPINEKYWMDKEASEKIQGCSEEEIKNFNLPSVAYGNLSTAGFKESMQNDKGFELGKTITSIVTDKTTTCAEKKNRLTAALQGQKVSTLDDFVLTNMIARKPELFMANPNLRQIMIEVMTIGRDLKASGMGSQSSTNFCLDGGVNCKTNRLNYIQLRNFLAGKYLDVLARKPFGKKNVYQFGTLSPAQQSEFAETMMKELESYLAKPQELLLASEKFRSDCDKKVSKMFGGAYCTVSGCGPDTIKNNKRNEAGRNVTGNLSCPGYDSGRDGRFHCYVDENLTSTRIGESEKYGLTLFGTKGLGCYRGSPLHLAKDHFRPCGKKICFGGDGGGGSADGAEDSGYLHIHMDFRIKNGEVTKTRVDPVDIFCRGECN